MTKLGDLVKAGIDLYHEGDGVGENVLNPDPDYRHLLEEERELLASHGVPISRVGSYQEVLFMDDELLRESAEGRSVEGQYDPRKDTLSLYLPVIKASAALDAVEEGSHQVQEAIELVEESPESLFGTEKPPEYVLLDVITEVYGVCQSREEAQTLINRLGRQSQSAGFPALDVDPHLVALDFDALRFKSNRPIKEELDRFYEQEVRDTQAHELIHKYGAEQGLPADVEEATALVWELYRQRHLFDAGSQDGILRHLERSYVDRPGIYEEFENMIAVIEDTPGSPEEKVSQAFEYAKSQPDGKTMDGGASVDEPHMQYVDQKLEGEGGKGDKNTVHGSPSPSPAGQNRDFRGEEGEVPDADVELAAEMAGVGEKKARDVLQETDGDLAEAIRRLQ